MSTPTLQIKGLKTWQGREGYGYQGDLYVDGKRAVRFHDDGNGGMTFVEYYDERGRWTARAPESGPGATFLAYVAALPADPARWGVEGKPSLDLVLAVLADGHETQKQLERACRTKTLYRLPDDEPGAYRTVRAAFSPEVRADIARRHPGASFVNETLPTAGGMAALGLPGVPGLER